MEALRWSSANLQAEERLKAARAAQEALNRDILKKYGTWSSVFLYLRSVVVGLRRPCSQPQCGFVDKQIRVPLHAEALDEDDNELDVLKDENG